jgi:hypothetical protein
MTRTTGLRGEFWPQDSWGRIVNAAVQRPRIARPALEAAEEAADLALERFGDALHSVYLSGPAARGRPGGAAFLILLRLAPGSTLDERSARDAWQAAAAQQIRQRHPAIGRCVFAVFEWSDVFTSDMTFSPARFRLAVNAHCIAGRNMSRMLAPQKIDAAVVNGDVLAFRSRMLSATNRISVARAPERVRAAAMDAGAAVIAAGFGLVMEREQVYTEDLDLRRDIFLLNYPARARAMQAAFAMTTHPTSDEMKALTFIDTACRWLTPMTDAWLNANNPHRAERLRA